MEFLDSLEPFKHCLGRRPGFGRPLDIEKGTWIYCRVCSEELQQSHWLPGNCLGHCTSKLKGAAHADLQALGLGKTSQQKLAFSFRIQKRSCPIATKETTSGKKASGSGALWVASSKGCGGVALPQYYTWLSQHDQFSQLYPGPCDKLWETTAKVFADIHKDRCKCVTPSGSYIDDSEKSHILQARVCNKRCPSG